MLAVLLAVGPWPLAMAEAPASASGPASGPVASTVVLESVGFVMRPDAQADYLARLTRWQAREKLPAPLAVQDELAEAADAQASIEAPLTVWRAQGGPRPWRFRARAHLANPGERAWLAVRVVFRWRAQVGDLLADPDVLLTDYDYLAASARWQTLHEETVTLAAMAPGEDALVDSAPFSLLAFLQAYPHRWPRRLRVEARLLTPPGSPQRSQAQIELIPDHFIVPDTAGRRMTQ